MSIPAGFGFCTTFHLAAKPRILWVSPPNPLVQRIFVAFWASFRECYPGKWMPSVILFHPSLVFLLLLLWNNKQLSLLALVWSCLSPEFGVSPSLNITSILKLFSLYTILLGPDTFFFCSSFWALRWFQFVLVFYSCITDYPNLNGLNKTFIATVSLGP